MVPRRTPRRTFGTEGALDTLASLATIRIQAGYDAKELGHPLRA
jgi:hypothetical protein